MIKSTINIINRFLKQRIKIARSTASGKVLGDRAFQIVSNLQYNAFFVFCFLSNCVHIQLGKAKNKKTKQKKTK